MFVRCNQKFIEFFRESAEGVGWATFNFSLFRNASADVFNYESYIIELQRFKENCEWLFISAIELPDNPEISNHEFRHFQFDESSFVIEKWMKLVVNEFSKYDDNIDDDSYLTIDVNYILSNEERLMLIETSDCTISANWNEKTESKSFKYYFELRKELFLMKPWGTGNSEYSNFELSFDEVYNNRSLLEESIMKFIKQGFTFYENLFYDEINCSTDFLNYLRASEKFTPTYSMFLNFKSVQKGLVDCDKLKDIIVVIVHSFSWLRLENMPLFNDLIFSNKEINKFSIMNVLQSLDFEIEKDSRKENFEIDFYFNYRIYDNLYEHTDLFTNPDLLSKCNLSAIYNEKLGETNIYISLELRKEFFVNSIENYPHKVQFHNPSSLDHNLALLDYSINLMRRKNFELPANLIYH